MAFNAYPASDGQMDVTPRRGSGFPPARKQGVPNLPNYDCPPVSTGKGGIGYSLKLKARGTKDAPGIDKTVNGF